MAGYLLDTNVVSETRKSRPDAGVIAFLSAASSEGLFLSVLTLGELRKGVALRRRVDPVAAVELGAWVEGIEANFADRILPIDSATALRWAELSVGRSLPVIDMLIAAAALNRDLTVVTRNTRDFASTGVLLLDPLAGPIIAGSARFAHDGFKVSALSNDARCNQSRGSRSIASIRLRRPPTASNSVRISSR